VQSCKLDRYRFKELVALVDWWKVFDKWKRGKFEAMQLRKALEFQIECIQVGDG
jgi:hypothetical protein